MGITFFKGSYSISYSRGSGENIYLHNSRQFDPDHLFLGSKIFSDNIFVQSRERLSVNEKITDDDWNTILELNTLGLYEILGLLEYPKLNAIVLKLILYKVFENFTT